jgi:chromate reductase, NAD(P)H dehydrogenase (quinone)
MISAFSWMLQSPDPARSRAASMMGRVRRPARTGHPIRILAIAGSLRQASSNSALVNVAAALPLASAELVVYGGLAALPPFNPDNDGDSVPEAVRRFRQHLRACDAVLIASPEYAHSVPGVLKNALDWVIESGELIDKPVALISASARTRYAWAALVEILTTMSARVIGEASIAMSLEGRTLDAVGMSSNLALRTSLTSALDALARAARDRRRLS